MQSPQSRPTRREAANDGGYKTFFHMFFGVERIIINGNKKIPRRSVYKIYTDMETKYVQKVIPRVSTERYRKMPLQTLRKEVQVLCDAHQGKVITNRHIGIPIQIIGYRRKTAYGEAVYSKKAAVAEKLDQLLEYAKYNNFGQRKETDPENIIGYYNFKAYVYIDNKKESVRLAVRARKDGSFYYNVEVDKGRKRQ